MFSTSGTGNLHYGFYLHEPCKMITVRNTCGKYVRGHIAPIIPGIALDYSGREGVFVPASIFGRIMAVMAYGIRMKYGVAAGSGGSEAAGVLGKIFIKRLENFTGLLDCYCAFSFFTTVFPDVWSTFL